MENFFATGHVFFVSAGLTVKPVMQERISGNLQGKWGKIHASCTYLA